MIRNLIRGLAIRALAAVVGISLIIALALAEWLNAFTALAAFAIWAALHFGLPWLWADEADGDFPEDQRPYAARYRERPKGD